MYLNPFRDFVKKVVNTGVSRKRRRSSLSRVRKSERKSRGPAPFTVAAELCEARTMLSGPALITVAPNTGGFITNGSLQTTAPTQLTFTFSPSTSIINTPQNLTNITVTRAGADHNLLTADDQAVAAGSIVVDSQNPNIVTLRFANSLVNDTYQIKIDGDLNSSTGFFNSQQDQTINFSVDIGAQVVSIVPQPVVRTEQLKIGGNAQSLDGQTIAVSMGGGTTVTFQLKNSSTASVVPPANTGVVYDPGDTTTVIAGKLAAAINTAATTNGNPLFNTLSTPVTNVGNQIALTGAAFTADVRLSVGGLNVSNAATITDLDTFTVTAQDGTVKTFQFKDNTTGSVITPGNVGIGYNPGASAATLTTAILGALNGASGFGAGFAVQNGNGVKFAGNPAVTLGTANASFLTLVGGAQVADGALVPKNDVITVYFSKTELVQSLAEDPAFYQVINTTDGSILEPASVKYDKVGNTAVLKFAASLPSGTFHVTIGAPKLNNTNVSNAVNAGTLYTNDGMAPLAGTLTWTNSSTTVNGAGTYFRELRAGDVLKAPDGNMYKVREIGGDLTLTLTTAYTGATTPGATSRYLFQAATNPTTVTGSTAWSNGSATVIGTGTSFTTELRTGQLILGADSRYYRITAIASDTSLTVANAFAGATQPFFTTHQLVTTATGQTALAGTTSWTNGLAAVTGVGTAFSNHLQVGQAIIGADNNFYTIAAITSDTALTLTETYLGNTEAGLTTNAVPYSAFVTVAYVGNLAGSSTSTSAFGLYKFTTAPGAGALNATINASDLAAAFGGAVRLRLFDAAGTTQLGASNTNSLTVVGLTGGTTYILGVSGVGNVYDPSTGLSTTPGVGTGSVKLTIGVTNTFNVNPQTNTTSFGTATDLGKLGDAGLTAIGQIVPVAGSLLYPPYPGGNDTPGNGSTQDTSPAFPAAQFTGERTDAAPGTAPAAVGRVPVFYYNFRDIYGKDPQGSTLHNAITQNQKNDARQIFDIYGSYLGVEFVETLDQGLTIVTGDVRAIAPGVDPNAVGGMQGTDVTFGFNLAVMNGQVNYGSSPYGGAWWSTAFHEIGHALGLQHSYDAPGVMGGGSENLNGGGLAFPDQEPVFPGDIALVPGKVLLPPHSVDLNVFKFVADVDGTLTAETFAQRLEDALGNSYPSLLDSVITVYSDAQVQAFADDSFGIGGGFNMKFTAKALGAAANGLQIVFTKSDLGASVLPKVSVAAGTINITLNTNPNASGGGTASTAQNVIDAINADVIASTLITATTTNPAQVVGNANLTPAFANLTLGGGLGNRTIIARNDDYFGRDSYVNIHLTAGTYYIAVSSTGNTKFDPSIPNSGFDGRTDGKYKLTLDFKADPQSSATLNDLGGVALAADGPNTSGGTFDFWFQSTSGGTGKTIYVDKANNADISQDGTIGHAYGTISAGLQAAAAFASTNPGVPTIVRIVGNGGFDGNLSSTADSLPYLIGYNSMGAFASDGNTFIIPQNVTVMVDAGAVVKVRNAIIDAGNTVPGVNRDGGSLQVLGTPHNNAIFTSLFNDTVGGRSDPFNFNPKAPGDWGGLVYRQGSDFRAKDWLNSGIYLNSVNQANITYGGGQVFDGSVLQTFDPIFLSNQDPNSDFFARPTVWFNNIQFSAGAAISADPNSFANTEDRSGPDVYGNLIINDTVNAFFIRIRTNAGQPIDTLGITARIQHTDITYVLAENLFLVGSPGGPYQPNPNDPTHTGWQARLAATLVLDPGVIMKLSGSRIETQVGQSQLIAEGTSTNPVIFTSLADDTYGAGGTFDTNFDGTAFAPKPGVTFATPKAGDWGGLFFNADGKGSVDHAVIQYGGGTVPIAGGFANFNPVEIQQADVRIANSLFYANKNGRDVSSRNGLQFNDAATIFIRGAQPVIVNNSFIQNVDSTGQANSIISVNANALNAELVPDWGRSTGLLDAFTTFVTNHGPLIALNTFINNAINGMRVRGEEITTQTNWDDTNIVHVLQSQIDNVINQHTFGGITLQSSTAASLVVKLSSGGGFNVNGIPLDIADRIGGTIQVIGTGAFPVVLTSLKDDKVGAGFQPDGQLVTDTNNNGSANNPVAGDWNGITLGPYTNDRNVMAVVEGVPTTPVDNNSTAAAAQFLGSLAPNLVNDTPNNPNGGNDYQPLGFAVHGVIAQPSDVDVYSFTAAVGTEVWFDLGLTSPALASVLELVDANGLVLARSNGGTGANVLTSFAVTALSLIKDPFLGGDFYTNNPHDAGMRVILPGAAGTTNTFYIRVRSDQAQSQGEYQLQIRRRQQWESAGSLIQFSSINYATTGIQINGLPQNSPLAGDTNSVGTNVSRPTAQNIGDMLASNQNSITVSGNLATETQVDWYRFELTYDLIQAIAGVNAGGKTWSTIFDINYAAGLTRPDTTISVFDAQGRLIMVSRDSNVTSNQPQALEGTGVTNLAGGSVSPLDPYLGSAQMPAGTPGSGNFIYYVAISSNLMIPQALEATFTAQSVETLVRLEPVESVQRIVEDHIGFTGFTTGNELQGPFALNHLSPVTPAILPIDTEAQLQQSVVPYTLQDLVLYTLNSANGDLRAVEPFSGQDEFRLGDAGDHRGNMNIKMRSDGTLWVYAGIIGNTGAAGEIYQIDPATGARLVTLGADSIADKGATDTDPNHLTTDSIDSFMWVQTGIGSYDLWVAAHDGGGTYNGGFGASRLYFANPANGSAVVANTPFFFRGEMTTSGSDSTTGFVTGMEVVNGTFYGVTSTGKFISFTGGGGITVLKDLGATVGGFTGLTLGPQNLANPNDFTQLGYYKDTLFATTTAGDLVCIDPTGAHPLNPQPGTPGSLLPVFFGGAVSVGTHTGGFGLAFSPLDFNLWHPTMNLFGDAGHGINVAFDNSRNTNNLSLVDLGPDDRLSNERQGGASFYFGLEDWIATPAASRKYFTYNGVNSQYGVDTGNFNFQQSLTSNNAASGLGNNYNLPGGAHGSMVTESFSLNGYSSNDFPTLYFNYLLGTEGDTSHLFMNDSARVFISQDNGVTWEQLASNNIDPLTNLGDRGLPINDFELPSYFSPSVNANLLNPITQQITPLYGTDQWRQARIDLAYYAGQPNLRLRFDFSTAGTTFDNNGAGATTEGLPGDFNGAGPNDEATARNNAHVGWYVDDLIIGFTNRGEMVTGDAANPTNLATFTPQFVQLPQNPAFGGAAQSLTGPYELDIRSGTEYAANTSGLSSHIIVTQQYDANQRFILGHSLTAPAGNSIADGQTFSISDGVKSVTFEFDSNNVLNTVSNQRIAFTTGDASPVVARTIRDSINLAASQGKFRVVAQTGDGAVTGTGFLTTSTNSTVDLTYAASVSAGSAAPPLTANITGATTISESGGSTTGNLTRPATGPLGAITVPLSLIDVVTGGATAAATITPSVSFGAGATTSTGFTVTATGNVLADGLRTIAVVPTFNGFTSVTAPVNVTDDETATLSFSGVTANVNEGVALAGSATINRNTVAGLNGEALDVVVTSLDPTRVRLISGVQSGGSVTVTIPAGATSANFQFEAIANGGQGDGTAVGIVALADGFVSASTSTTTVDTTTAAQTIPQGTIGTIVDTTPATTANQTNGNIAIGKVFSAGSNFGTDVTAATAVWLGFQAKVLGTPATPIILNFTKADLGNVDAANILSVVGSTINIELNNNIGASAKTTANALMTAINGNAPASALIRVAVSMGAANAGTTNLTTTAAASFSLTLSQGIFAASNTEGAGSLNVSYSTDGGTTWQTRAIATGAGAGKPEEMMPVADGSNSKPSVAADEYGNLFLIYRSSNGPSLNVALSTDFGQSFSLLQGMGIDANQPRIVTANLGANSVVWFAYRLNSSDLIQVKGTPVTGLGAANINSGNATPFTAGAAVQQNAPGSNGVGADYPSIAVGPNGQVAVVWVEPTIPAGQTRVRISIDPDGLGVSGFGFPSQVAVSNVLHPTDSVTAQGSGSINVAPDIAWDKTVTGTSSRMYVVYTDKNVVTGKNIILRTNTWNSSTNSLGGAWTVVTNATGGVFVNDDTNNSDQFMPRVAVDNFGTPASNPTQGDVVVTWYDTRNGGASSPQLFGAVYSRLRQTLGNFQIGGTENAAASASGNGLGAYNGLDVVNGAFFPLWADNTASLVGNNGFSTTLDQATMHGIIDPAPAAAPKATVTIVGPITQGTVGVNAGTITIPTPAVGNQIFTLTSSDTSIITVPATVTILNGNSSANFNVTAVGFGGVAYVRRSATVSGARAGFESVAGKVDVTGGPTPSLTISGLAGSVGEGNTITGTVTRNSPTDNPLVVTLYSTAPFQLSGVQTSTLLAQIIIPAGAASVQFTLTGVQDYQVDGNALVNFFAVAQGYVPDSQGVTVNDSGQTLFSSYQLKGDWQTVRQQGHLQISNNTISYAQQFGIAIDSGVRNPANLPHPGSVRNLPTLNGEQLVPGPNIVNNVINNFGIGGILFAGDPNTGNVAEAAVPFGRIVNNTISGGGTSQGGSAKVGTGITVQDNASPTIINNIVANTNVGISVDNTSTTTIVTTTAYKNNNTNLTGVAQTFELILQAADPLFVNAALGNFYLAAGSKAIDSSLNTLQDRASIAAVLSAIGLPESPIISPISDVRGQLRVDDATVPNAVGLGQNIYIDRGAVERADFVGPTAQLVQPLDNGPGDGDAALNTVFITTTTPLTVLAIRLNDGGSGIDNSTVTSAAFELRQNGIPLISGQDYQFVYDPNTHTVQFQSISVFPSSNTYTITVPTLSIIKDLAGNNLQPNQQNGTEVFTIVGNVPPTLSSITPFAGVQDIVKDITYAQLLAASSPANLSVVAGHTPQFKITSVPNGVLRINANPAPIVADQIVAPGDILHWTPPAGQAGSFTAFNVAGWDPINAVVAPQLAQSANTVGVTINVVNPTPLLSNNATLGIAAINPLAFPIQFANLVNGLGAVWNQAVGNDRQFQITGVINGTLRLNNVVQGAFPFIVTPADSLTWTPPAVLPGSPPPGGTDLVPGFTIRAFDNFNAVNFPTIPAYSVSTPVRTVSINVLNVNPPTVVNTTINLGPKPQKVASTFSYSELQTASGAALGAGNAGDTLALRIESITPGTSLQITHLGVTSTVTPAQIAAQSAFVLPGDTVTWTPTLAATGNTAAFTFSAFDVEKNLDGFTNVLTNVNLVNLAPTLSVINTLVQADAQTPFSINYPMLLGASNAADPNGDVLSFGFNAFTPAQTANGTLQIVKSGTINPVNVTPGSTSFAPGDTLIWTPKPGIAGNAVNAFNVFASDGALTSASVQVNIKVRALGTAFDLSGPWVVENGAGAVQGLGRITQNGASLTLVNFNGQGSNASYTALNKMVAASYNGQANVVGTIDTIAADQGRILWSDGTVWLRVLLGGTYAVSSPGNPNVSIGTISQNGVLLTFSNAGASTTGTVQNSSQILVNTGGGSTMLETYGDGRINFANGPQGFAFGGQTWTKLDLPPDYTNPGGSATHVIQNGTATLTFVDKFGGTSPGFWTGPTRIFTTLWNVGATVGNGKISWDDGTVWSEALLLNGSKNGAGKTTINATPATVGVSNYFNPSNNMVHVVQTGTTNVVFVDKNGNMVLGTWITTTQVLAPGYGNAIATFSPGKVSWNDGTVWTLTNAPGGTLTVTDYSNPNGVPVHIVRNNTNNLCIVDGLGRTSLGTMLDPATGIVNLYPSDQMHFNGNTVTWDSGFVWTQVATVPPMITFTDTNGTSFHVKLTSRTTLIGLDGAMKNVTATRLNGKLFWSNGVIWDNWDFNDLNALFQMHTGYP